MNTKTSVTVETYHVFGSGGSCTWFRQTRDSATNPNIFFPALDAVKENAGNNGFVGTYKVSHEFMEEHGWEASTMYWPPCDDYARTPKPADGWLVRAAWTNGGFETLNAGIPAFRPGYYTERRYQGTRDIVFVENETSHRNAILNGHEIHYFDEMGDGVHKLDYRWGDQPASAYILLKEGRRLDYVQGCGDRAPYISESDEKCLADGRLYTSDDMSDRMADQREYEKKFWEVADHIGLADEYRKLCDSEHSEENDQKTSEMSRQIELAMANFEADDRAKADKTGILCRLLKRYRNHQNPLPTLRKEKGGTWTFHRTPPDSSKFPEGTVVYHGEKWWVSWIK